MKHVYAWYFFKCPCISHYNEFKEKSNLLLQNLPFILLSSTSPSSFPIIDCPSLYYMSNLLFEFCFVQSLPEQGQLEHHKHFASSLKRLLCLSTIADRFFITIMYTCCRVLVVLGSSCPRPKNNFVAQFFNYQEYLKWF